MTIDRRDFLIASSLAAGGLMMPAVSPLSLAHAAAPMAGSQVAGLYRTKVGGIEITSMLDGSMSLPQSVLMSAPESMIAAARETYALPAGDTLPAFVNTFLINTPTRTVLVDTGARGSGPTLGKMRSLLDAASITPSQIDSIIITHAHPDHVGGLLDESVAKVFDKSTIMICEDELAFWYDDTAMGAAGDKKGMFEAARKFLGPYKESGQIQTFKAGADLGQGLTAHPLIGHTPGHHGVRIEDGGEQFLIWADLVHFPAVQFDHPEQSVGFDIDPEAAQKARQKTFEEAAGQEIRVAGMHLFFPAIGHVVAKGQGFSFVPQLWETSL